MNDSYPAPPSIMVDSYPAPPTSILDGDSFRAPPTIIIADSYAPRPKSMGDYKVCIKVSKIKYLPKAIFDKQVRPQRGN